MRKVVILLIGIFLFGKGFSQNQQTSSDSIHHESVFQLIARLESKYDIHFYYTTSWFQGKMFPVKLEDLPLDVLLMRVKNLTGYDAISIGNHSYVFIPSESIPELGNSYDNNAITVVGSLSEYGKYSKATIKGKLVDGKTGNPLSGAIISIDNPNISVATDKDGSFSIEIPVGTYDVKMHYLGYEEDVKKIQLVGNGSVTLELFERTQHIDEVVISAEKIEENVSRTEMSVIKLNAKSIKELPSSLGEKDIIKGFTLMPGVQSVGEYGTGFNVRGGTADQNLILIQDVPLFNSSHVFGLTSSINPDDVQNAVLLKGGIPAQYGERVSSLMEIELGNAYVGGLKVKGGIGLLDSRLTIETPLVGDKMSLQLGARSSYSDWLLTNVPNQDLMNSAASFYDVNGLLTWNLNSVNKFTLFGYYSYDYFLYDGTINYNYSNILASLKWQHVYDKTLSSSTVLGLSQYIYNKNSFDTLQLSQALDITTKTSYYKFKENFNWIPNVNHNLNFGIDAILYNLQPGKQTPGSSESNVLPAQVQGEKAVEMAVYVDDLIPIGERLKIEAGVRFTDYLYLGKDSLYQYNPAFARSEATVTGVRLFGNNAIVESLPKLEPRFSFRYSINESSSVKLSYNRINQFINLISNTAVVSPEDVWKLSDPNTKPLQCDQYGIGYFHNYNDNMYETSLEVYYKNLKNVIDYMEGTSILMNTKLDLNLLNDMGYNYGAELYIKKNNGTLTGWLSYTYSVARQRTTSNFLLDQINGNSFYASNNDRPNDLVINLNYHATKRWRFSALFNYSTGRPATYPEYTYMQQGFQIVEWSDRNKYRLPDYNRLDLSIILDESLRLKKFWKGSWTLSVINVYSRENVYTTYYQKVTPSSSNNYSSYSLFKMYIVGRPLPTLTYNFIF